MGPAGKFSPALDDSRDVTFWRENIVRYLDRAILIGVDNPNGRQAFAKAVATASDALESIVRKHGPLPEPGHTSGEIVEWKRDD